MKRSQAYFLLAGLASAASMVTDGTVAQEFKVKMTYPSLSKSVVMPLSPAHVVIVINGTAMGVVAANPNDPAAGSTGQCGGLMEIKKGQPSGNGYCSFSDLDKHKFNVAFKVTGMTPKRLTSGEWKYVGGTGKWTGVTGGGTYRFSPTATENVTINHVEGIRRMK